MAELLGALLLLLGNALFVAGEFSLIASRRTAVEPLAAASRLARAALRAMDQIPLMIAGAQLGITVCSLGLGAIAAPALSGPLVSLFGRLRLPLSTVHPAAFLLALALVVFLHTVVGEMVPKNLTLAGPERAVLWLGAPMLGFCLATKPVLVAMKGATKVILRMWRIDAPDAVKTVFTAEELAALVTQARTEGLLDREEHARIAGALALHHRRAIDAMRPWSEVTTVTQDTTPAMIEELAIRTGRSRLPVVARDGGRVLGFVHVKDSLWVDAVARSRPVPAGSIRSLAAVPPDLTLAELLLAMRRERWHIVLVSPGRGVLGIVTLQDVLAVIAPVPAAGVLT
jgi:CBS domain containing-hemolysin-like protein